MRVTDRQNYDSQDCASVARAVKTDVDKLERVQKRATKLIPELSRKSCSDRLKVLNLPTLKGTLRRRLSHGYFSFIAKYTSN